MTLLNRWLTGSSAYANYQKFVRKIVAPLFTKFGVQIIDNEPKLDRYARQIATNLACEAGLEACLVQTAAKLQELVIDAANIHPDLQSAIYCNGLRQGNATTFNFLREKMLASQDQAERTLIIAALGCSGDSALLTNYLSLTLQSGDSLRLQEKFRVLAAPMNNGELGLQVMMQFIENNYAGVNALKQVDTMLGNIAPRVASQKIYDDFNKTLTFLVGANHLTEESANAYRVRANSNLEWQDKHLQKIGNWLDDTEDTTTTTTASATSKVISTIAITSCALIKYFI